MSRITREQFSKSRPTLKVDDLRGADTVVVRIANVEEVEIDGQKKLVMDFEEFPDNAYWPNVTSIGNLIEHLGDDTDDWKGQRVALERVKTNNPQTKKAVDALWVVASDEQTDVIAAAKRNGRPAPARKATRKRGAKAK